MTFTFAHRHHRAGDVQLELITGDCLDVMRQLTAEGRPVDCVLTSPPFYNLRAEGEGVVFTTPADYVDWLLDRHEAMADVISPWGSIVVELGDTMAGSGGSGGDYNPGGLREGQGGFEGSAKTKRRTTKTDEGWYGVGGRPLVGGGTSASPWRSPVNGRRSRAIDEAAGILSYRYRPGPDDRDHQDGHPLDKSQYEIPEAYRLSVTYGWNVLRGKPRTTTDDYGNEVPTEGRFVRRMRLRNTIRWIRTNPPVGSLSDSVRRATSDAAVFAWDRKRWFDLDAVRSVNPRSAEAHQRTPKHKASARGGARETNRTAVQNPGGAPPLDWTEDFAAVIDRALEGGAERGRDVVERLVHAGLLDRGDAVRVGNKGTKLDHYSVWPMALVAPLVEMMCPRRVCRTCNEPSRRITRSQRTFDGDVADLPALSTNEVLGQGATGAGHWRVGTNRGTLGWTACDCPGTEGVWATDFKWSVALDEAQAAITAARRARGRLADLDPDTSEALDAKEAMIEHQAEAERLYAAIAENYIGDLDGWHEGDGWRPGVVLDPFCGSGTTLAAAASVGREAIGIELNASRPATVRKRLRHLLFGEPEITAKRRSVQLFDLESI